jgi:hypothetical protein
MKKSILAAVFAGLAFAAVSVAPAQATEVKVVVKPPVAKVVVAPVKKVIIVKKCHWKTVKIVDMKHKIIIKKVKVCK